MNRTKFALLAAAAASLASCGVAAAQYPYSPRYRPSPWPVPGRPYPYPGSPYPGPGAPGFQPGVVPNQPLPVTQLRNVISGEFLYTVDPNEANNLVAAGTHQQHGRAFSVLAQPAPGTVALVRYVRGNGTHFLATSPQPAQLEGTVGYVYAQPQPGTVPIITWHSPELSQDFYTTDPRNGEPARWGFQRADVLGYTLP